MKDFIFYFFAILATISGLMVTLSRNAINAAMYMILSFISVAGLFILLEAYVLGILQVLVYAGAIMVLFLFIIMLLNVDTLGHRPLDKKRLLMVSLFFALLMLVVTTGLILGINDLPSPCLVNSSSINSSTFSFVAKDFARLLFTKYLLIVELLGFLLLMGVVGVIVLSKNTVTFCKGGESHES